MRARTIRLKGLSVVIGQSSVTAVDARAHTAASSAGRMDDRFVPRIRIPFTAASPSRVGAQSGGLAREAPPPLYDAQEPPRKQHVHWSATLSPTGPAWADRPLRRFPCARSSRSAPMQGQPTSAARSGLADNAGPDAVGLHPSEVAPTSCAG
jgi:hypothetical protein